MSNDYYGGDADYAARQEAERLERQRRNMLGIPEDDMQYARGEHGYDNADKQYDLYQSTVGTVLPLVTANTGAPQLITLHALDENNNPGPILTWRVDDVKGWYGPVVRFRSAQQTIYATIVHLGNTSFTVAETSEQILVKIAEATQLPAPYISDDEADAAKHGGTWTTPKYGSG